MNAPFPTFLGLFVRRHANFLALPVAAAAIAAPPTGVGIRSTDASILDADGELDRRMAWFTACMLFGSREPSIRITLTGPTLPDSLRANNLFDGRELIKDNLNVISSSFSQTWGAASIAALQERFPRRTYGFEVQTDAFRTFEIDHTQPFLLPRIGLESISQAGGPRHSNRVRLRWSYEGQPLQPGDQLSLSITEGDFGLGSRSRFGLDTEATEALTSAVVKLSPNENFTALLSLERNLLSEQDPGTETRLTSEHVRFMSFPFSTDFLEVEPQAPAILRHPGNVSAAPGEPVVLGALAEGRPAPTYQWLKDGEPIPGAVGPNIDFEMSALDSGSYRVAVENAAGQTLSEPAEVAIGAPRAAPMPTLVNLSTRAAVAGDGRQAIAGFVIEGKEPLRVLVRAVGPQLREAGIQNVLGDPQIDLFDAAPARLVGNDDWTSRIDADAIEQAARELGAGPLDRAEGLESALYLTMDAGRYTVIAENAVTGSEGIGLVEVFRDIRFPSKSRMTNLSTRGHVGSGDQTMIGGFVVAGEQPRTYLLRGVGPDLEARGVADFIPDPLLRLFDASAAALAENDDWDPALADAFAAAGADPFEPGSRDAALLATLDPGIYTVHLLPANGAEGVGLVEIFELPHSP